jgi:Glycosyl transferases group 1
MTEMFVVSLREMVRMPAQGCVAEMEDVFAEVTQATLLCPETPERFVEMTAGLPAAGADLFIACLSLADVVDLFGNARRWRRPFRRVFCYVFDAWVEASEIEKSPVRRRISRFTRVVHQIDHLFVSNPDSVADHAAAYDIPVSYVALAADVLQFGSMQAERPITVNAYGRQHPPHVDALARAYNTNRSSRALYHTDHMSIGTVFDLRRHRASFWKLLSMSCITLAYDHMTVDPGQRRFPFSFVGQRWFEGLAAGCVVVGIRPQCAETDRLLHWPDATIDVPESPDDFMAFVESLLADGDRLARARVANYRHMLLAHDWGYRVVEMLAAVGIEAPIGWSLRQQNLRRELPPEPSASKAAMPIATG